MNKGLSLAFAFVLVSVSIGEPQFEIRDGDCIKVVPADLVMSRHVNLAGIPSMSREDKATWSGDHKIYCILAISMKHEDRDSRVNITDGGLNRTFVTLQLKSSTGKGLEYFIAVYANSTSKA